MSTGASLEPRLWPLLRSLFPCLYSCWAGFLPRRRSLQHPHLPGTETPSPGLSDLLLHHVPLGTYPSALPGQPERAMVSAGCCFRCCCHPAAEEPASEVTAGVKAGSPRGAETPQPRRRSARSLPCRRNSPKLTQRSVPLWDCALGGHGERSNLSVWLGFYLHFKSHSLLN